MLNLLKLCSITSIAFVMAAAPACAYEDEDALALIQKPSTINVSYGYAQNGDLTLKLVATPVLAACGTVKDMPTKVDMDIEAVDVTVKDYSFIRQTGTMNRDCGAASKVGAALVTIKADDLKTHSVTRIRLWYNGLLDTYYIDQVDGKPKLRAPLKPKFFFLDERAYEPAPVAEAPPVAETHHIVNTTAPTTPMAQITAPTDATKKLLLSVGDVKVDDALTAEMTALAVSRGLAATDQPHVFIDNGGQFYAQLAFRSDLIIGYLNYQNQRWPVIATRTSEEKK
jgi:hypothetical protein